MPTSSPSSVFPVRYFAKWFSFVPIWPVVVCTTLLGIGLSLPWMQLYHPNFGDQSPFLRPVGGITDSLLWPLVGLSMILLALMQLRYRLAWLVLLTLLCCAHLWFAYDALQAWRYLNEIEQGQPLAERAPTASAGIGLYLSAIGIVLTLVSVIRYRRTLDT